jgi:dTDP-L-rhamnose 4-epimerase
VDAVVHLAARVGVGQSMYEVAEYTAVNSLGTATLVQALIERPIERLVVASSMSIYGEGSYIDAEGIPRIGRARSVEQLRRHEWEVLDQAGRPLIPVPTNESKPPSLASVYALSKLDQEQLCLTVGQAYGIEAVALRLFNVYGPRQALSNPYTGVMAIFSSRMLLGRPPLINEDGQQRRDFVNVHDVVDAFVLALERPGVSGRAYNIASGSPVTIEEVARRLGQVLARPNVAPVITGAYRAGDIRHCCADITLAKEVLGFQPKVTLEQGLDEMAAWLAEGHMPEDNVERAREELSRRGLAL